MLEKGFGLKKKKDRKGQRNKDIAGTGSSGSSANASIPASIIHLDAKGKSVLSFKPGGSKRNLFNAHEFLLYKHLQGKISLFWIDLIALMGHTGWKKCIMQS